MRFYISIIFLALIITLLSSCTAYESEPYIAENKSLTCDRNCMLKNLYNEIGNKKLQIHLSTDHLNNPGPNPFKNEILYFKFKHLNSTKKDTTLNIGFKSNHNKFPRKSGYLTGISQENGNYYLTYKFTLKCDATTNIDHNMKLSVERDISNSYWKFDYKITHGKLGCDEHWRLPNGDIVIPAHDSSSGSGREIL